MAKLGTNAGHLITAVSREVLHTLSVSFSRHRRATLYAWLDGGVVGPRMPSWILSGDCPSSASAPGIRRFYAFDLVRQSLSDRWDDPNYMVWNSLWLERDMPELRAMRMINRFYAERALDETHPLMSRNRRLGGSFMGFEEAGYASMSSALNLIEGGHHLELHQMVATAPPDVVEALLDALFARREELAAPFRKKETG